MTEHAIVTTGIFGQSIDADYRVVAVMLGLLLTIVVVYLLTKRSA